MQTKKTKSYYDKLRRIDKHKDYLWKTIYDLRHQITDYVLKNTINNEALPYKPLTHWKALKLKAHLIRKYSLKLREFDTIRWNEDISERV